MAALPQVTICVPVWNGARFVAETLDTITRQTYPNLQVLISDDASTDGSVELCKGIAERHGFELIVQPERRGWVGNCNFLLERAAGDFICIIPHDDLLDERYIEVLAAHLSATPVCAQAFCDIRAFGSRNDEQPQSSLVGRPFERLYQHITRHFNGTPFRGLIRRDALDRAGGVPAGPVGFAPDISWIAHLALQGEIHRVPEILYFKRYYESSTHAGWFLLWDDETKIAAWADHCAYLLGIALDLDLSAAEQWLITHAAVRRLIMADGPYPQIRRLPIARKAEMVEALLARFESRFLAAETSVEGRRRIAALMVEALAAENAAALVQALEVSVPEKATGSPPPAAQKPVVVPRTPANILRFLRKKPLKLRPDE